MDLLFRLAASRPFLLVVFYVAVLPIGLLLRTFGYDPMARRLDADTPTFRTPSIADPMLRMDRD